MRGLKSLLAPLFRSGEMRDIGEQWHPAHVETIRCLMSVIDAGSPFTRGYSFRVARLAGQMADHLKLSHGSRVDLEYAALLHDIGRSAIHRDIFLRAGPLNDSEQAIVRSHPQVGYALLKTLPLLERVAGIVLKHHERPDGLGYPDGLAGEQIPMESRIIMVASAFDALAVDRPYRRGLGIDGAIEEIRRHAGTQFFPEVVDALVSLWKAGQIRLDDGDDARAEAGPGRNVMSLVDKLLKDVRTSSTRPTARGIEPSPALLQAMDPRKDPPSDQSDQRVA